MARGPTTPEHAGDLANRWRRRREQSASGQNNSAAAVFADRLFPYSSISSPAHRFRGIAPGGRKRHSASLPIRWFFEIDPLVAVSNALSSPDQEYREKLTPIAIRAVYTKCIGSIKHSRIFEWFLVKINPMIWADREAKRLKMRNLTL